MISQIVNGTKWDKVGQLSQLGLGLGLYISPSPSPSPIGCPSPSPSPTPGAPLASVVRVRTWLIFVLRSGIGHYNQ